jgi:hypothetical protein
MCLDVGVTTPLLLLHGYFVLEARCDVKKRFPKVVHDILISMLAALCVLESLNEWCKSWKSFPNRFTIVSKSEIGAFFFPSFFFRCQEEKSDSDFNWTDPFLFFCAGLFVWLLVCC